MMTHLAKTEMEKIIMLKEKKEIFAAEYLMQKAELGLELFEELLEVGLVKPSDEVAIMTIYNSCSSRINDVKYKHKKWYADKTCDFTSPTDFVWEILTKRVDLWKSWLKQMKIYKASGWSYKERPTIDRIDSSKGYSLDNIQVLSSIDNSLKDKQLFR